MHRLELQETERAALEAALAGRFVTNAVSAAGSVFSGIGNMLTPFAGALTAIAGVWLADKTLDEVLDAVKDSGEKQKQENLESYTDEGIERMDYFGALIQSAYDENGVQGLIDLLASIIANKNSFIGAPTELMPILIPSWWRDICIQFLGTITTPDNTTGGYPTDGQTPRDLWSAWLSIEEYQQYAYYNETGGTGRGAIWKTLFG